MQSKEEMVEAEVAVVDIIIHHHSIIRIHRSQGTEDIHLLQWVSMECHHLFTQVMISTTEATINSQHMEATHLMILMLFLHLKVTTLHLLHITSLLQFIINHLHQDHQFIINLHLNN